MTPLRTKLLSLLSASYLLVAIPSFADDFVVFDCNGDLRVVESTQSSEAQDIIVEVVTEEETPLVLGSARLKVEAGGETEVPVREGEATFPNVAPGKLTICLSQPEARVASVQFGSQESYVGLYGGGAAALAGAAVVLGTSSDSSSSGVLGDAALIDTSTDVGIDGDLGTNPAVLQGSSGTRGTNSESSVQGGKDQAPTTGRKPAHCKDKQSVRINADEDLIESCRTDERPDAISVFN